MIAAATLVSGCIVAPRPYGYQQPMPIYRDTTAYQQTYPDSAPEPIVAYTAPPPPQDEVIGIDLALAGWSTCVATRTLECTARWLCLGAASMATRRQCLAPNRWALVAPLINCVRHH